MKTVVNPKRPISTGELLDAIPVRNRTVVVESRSDREAVLSVPLRKKWYMKPPFTVVFPFSTKRRVALDQLGLEVWDHCDGRSTTEKIVETFAAKHTLTFHESRISVMMFLKLLTQRGMLVMVGAATQENAQ
jgi:hypothetical protein